LQGSVVHLETVLPVTGTYTIVLNGAATANRAYAFRATLPPDNFMALPPGAQVNVTVATPGQRDHYTFDAAAGDLVLYRGVAAPALYTATLTGPDGRVVFSRAANTTGTQVLLTLAGTYRLTIAPPARRATIGSYSFQFITTAGAAPVTRGSVVTGTLGPGTSTLAYTLTGTRLERLLIDNLSPGSATDSLSRWTLYGPNGLVVAASNLVFQPTNNDLDVILQATGTYTLVLTGGNASGDVSYAFNVTV
jgi:hypothetical protein